MAILGILLVYFIGFWSVVFGIGYLCFYEEKKKYY